MLTGAITVASGASITLVASSRPPRPTSSSTHIGRMLREQAERRRGFDFENGDRRAGIGALAMFERRAQFVVADQSAAAGPAEAEAFVDPHQIRRGVDVDAQAGRFQDRAQIGDRRTLAIGAGDMNHRRQPAFGMIEPLQQPMHPLQTEIDPLRMQRGQPRDQFAERQRRVGRRRVHAWGAAGATSAADTIWAGMSIGGAGFDTASTAGDFVSNRHSRASVGRRSWRCTTMSIMPWSLQIFRALKTFRQFLADGLFDHARAGKADQRAGLGDLHVAEHGIGGGDAAGGRIGQHHDIGQFRLAQHLHADGGARHLHQRQNAFLHAGAAGGREHDERRFLFDRKFKPAHDRLAGGHAERAAHEIEILHRDHDGRRLRACRSRP